MELVDIQPAIAQIAANPAVNDLRSITYLATYPSIRALGTAAGPIGLDRLYQVAAMAYGWMPRIVRIDPLQTANALAALIEAHAANPMAIHNVNVDDIAVCLHSVVGASKVLHFVNDSVFPIWDSRVENFRLHGPPGYGHMQDTNNYWAYVDDVQGICVDPAFPAFFAEFTEALNARFNALGIAHYPISHVRAIEAAARELG